MKRSMMCKIGIAIAVVVLGYLGYIPPELALMLPVLGTTSRSSIPDEVNNFYDQTLLIRAVPLMVHATFGQKRNISENAGTRTIKFRRYGSLAAATTPLVEGTTPAGKDLSVTDITAIALQYGDFTTITDRVTTESIDPVLTEATEIFGEQQGDTNDVLSRDILVAGTNVQYASSATSRVTVAAGMNLKIAEVKKAVRQLKLDNARKLTRISNASTGVGTLPIDAAFVAIVHPNTGFDLKGEAGFTPVEKYNSNIELLPGEIGKLDEVRFVETTNAKVFTGEGAAGIDVYATLVLGSEAYGVVDLANSQASQVIFKALGTSGAADPLNQRQTLGWKEYFVTKILNDNFLIRIEHAVSA